LHGIYKDKDSGPKRKTGRRELVNHCTLITLQGYLESGLFVRPAAVFDPGSSFCLKFRGKLSFIYFRGLNQICTMLPVLSSRKEINVRFSEVDSLRMVWHGYYLQYFEDGREDFGNRHGLGYLDVYAGGLVIPLVKAELDYKRPLAYGDTAIVETRFVDSPAAKLIFDYSIFKASTGELVCSGRTIQVFLNTNGELQLNCPDFLINWKKKVGLIS
jgi:acyl-CoA thioester hydrolase